MPPENCTDCGAPALHGYSEHAGAGPLRCCACEISHLRQALDRARLEQALTLEALASRGWPRARRWFAAAPKDRLYREGRREHLRAWLEHCRAELLAVLNADRKGTP